MLIAGFPTGSFQANCYVVAPGPGGECLVVDPGENAAARDAAVLQMLEANPTVVAYLRRALLAPPDDQMHLLDALVALTRREVGTLREASLASSERQLSEQVVSVLVRQMGELLLRPMIDAVWERVAGPNDTAKPTLTVRVDS